MLKKLGTAGETKNDIYQSWGAVITERDDIRGITVYFNPYFKGKDPFKEVFLGIESDPNGTTTFIRNPFVSSTLPYGYDQTTAEFWANSPYGRGNIDPVFTHNYLQQTYY